MPLVIQLGNPAPIEILDGETVPLSGPAVTEIRIEPNLIDGVVRPGYIAGTDVTEMLRHMALNPGPVKHLGGNELVQDVIGQWAFHGAETPSFVNVADPGPYNAADMEDFERFLSEYWDCPRGAPGDLEDVYFTEYDRVLYAPGENPEAAILLEEKAAEVLRENSSADEITADE